MLSAASLTACGQKGPLFLPGDAAASSRATLPEAVSNTVKSSVSPGSESPSQPVSKQGVDSNP